MTHTPTSFVCVGKILGPQGLQGTLRVCYYTERPETLKSFKPLYVGDEKKPLMIKHFKPGRQKEVIIQCSQINDRTAAEALKGKRLWVQRSALPQLEEEEYYYTDLIGLTVKLADSEKDYGIITAVHNFGAGDVLALAVREKGVVYIPFQKRTVLTVNCKAGYVIINPQVIEEIVETSSNRKVQE